MTKTIELVPTEKMSSEEMMSWVQNRFQDSARIFQDAAAYCSDMEHHHNNVATLVGRLNELKGNSSDEAKEEFREVLTTVAEIVGAMESLKSGNLSLSENSMDIDSVEKDFKSSEDFRKIEDQLNQEGRVFLEKYNRIKNRLGLKTQQDVSDLTGIDRRQISRIESGTCKPQFKTIQKIANGFGVRIEDLL